MKKTSLTTKPKRFASVQELVAATAANEEQVREFEHKIKGEVIVNALIRNRAGAGMTQADVADRMGCSQSAISKLEHSADAELTLQEVAGYLQAVGGRLNFSIGKQPNRVERIKELAISLKDELESLADLSSGSDDSSIRQSINDFFGEAWFNFFKILCDATSKLSKESEGNSPLVRLRSKSTSATIFQEAQEAGS